MKNTLRFAGTVLSAAAALTTVGLASTGTAEARPIAPVPLSWPGCPTDHPEGPCRWCPGDPPVQTGNRVTNPVVWDNNVCHTFEGETPPPPPPPPPPAIISTREQCLAILGPLICPGG